jgi:hypothetical protein
MGRRHRVKKEGEEGEGARNKMNGCIHRNVIKQMIDIKKYLNPQ